MVLAYHLIWTAYGWWLPNDPRGSMSRAIASDLIAELGALHYGRKTIQPAGWVIRAFYEHAADALKHPLLALGPAELVALAAAISRCIHDRPYTCYACAIMPDHIHVLIRKHRDPAEEMIANLQEISRRELRALGLRGADHPVWGGPGWKVFLNTPGEIRRTIRYVEQNPVKLGQPVQRWPFVVEYDGWPLHRGHSPSSPWARAIRAHRDHRH